MDGSGSYARSGREVITLQEYLMGRDEEYPNEYSEEIRENAKGLIAKVNAYLEDLGIEKVKVSSGWRPPSYNRQVFGAAPNSLHMTGHAVDISDPHRYLARKLILIENLALLDKHGLHAENPEKTKTWIHLQDIAPKSGRRIFNP